MATIDALLIDTHTFLWASFVPERLSRNARKLLTNAETKVYLSVASLWEIELKHRKGKLQADAKVVDASMRDLQILPLAIMAAHVRALAKLKSGGCKDPFDRMIGAQALAEELPLVTADPAFDEFGGVDVRW